ncbi:MAG: hypothetical protein K2V38_10570, partial [Gemmataceae bacterium]|nr:hypothetical protein [Gemmataceae bacterium]
MTTALFLCALVMAQPPATTAGDGWLALEFEKVRPSLSNKELPDDARVPADGEIKRVSLDGDGEWVEFALGASVRAHPDERTKERGHLRPLGSPGLAARDGYLAVRAGFAVRKKVDVLGEYHDGVVACKVAVRVTNGKLTARVYDVEVDWNKGLIESLVNFAAGVEGKLERDVQARASALLPKVLPDVEKQLGDLLKKQFPFVRQENVSLDLADGKLLVGLGRPEPPQPTDPSIGWAVKFVPLNKEADGVTVLVNGEFWNPRGLKEVGATWRKSDGEMTLRLPEKWQTAEQLRVVGVSRGWGKKFLVVILRNGRPVEFIM